jgi:hypothetical protein
VGNDVAGQERESRERFVVGRTAGRGISVGEIIAFRRVGLRAFHLHRNHDRRVKSFEMIKRFTVNSDGIATNSGAERMSSEVVHV